MREDWIECKIKDVGEITSGGTPSTSVSEYWDGDISWISPSDLTGYKEKFISKGKKSITLNGLNKSSARLIPAGSVLFSSRAPIGYVVIAKNELATNQGFKNVSPSKVVDTDFLYHFLKNSKQVAERVATGTTFKEISKDAFGKLTFPLPPLPEQRAIVKKLESLFSSLDAGVADLKKAQQQLKIYRQAVLKKAFEGEMNSKKLGEIAEITSSRRIFKDEYVTSGIPFYRTKEIKELSQGLKPAIELFIPISRYEEIKKNNDLPKTNDILISAVGTIGVSYVIRDNEPFYFKDGNLVWIKNPQINSYFLHYYFENKVRFSNSIDTSGSAYNALTIEKLKNFNITFPENITEQELIVKQIESRLSVCDSIEQNIKESLIKAEALRQSILKKAFEGNLLSAQELAECKQAADYEPARVLLERIRSEELKIRKK